MQRTPTPSQTAGPFFHLGLTLPASVGCLLTPRTNGERLQLICRVFDGEGAPVSDAMIELWQADAGGQYFQAQDAEQDFRSFGRLATGENGTCTFETIKPGRVPGNGNTLQAPHINVSVFARGLLVRLATRIYFAGEPANEEDSILALVPAERRETLMAELQEPGAWRFDIHLCGERETVFFDI